MLGVLGEQGWDDGRWRFLGEHGLPNQQGRQWALVALSASAQQQPARMLRRGTCERGRAEERAEVGR